MSGKHKLVYLKNNEEYILDCPTMLVGRSDSCLIQVEESNLSREHARIQVRDDAVFVQDLHSTNGTFVNKKRIEEATELVPGSVVQFGEESFSLQLLDHEVTILSVPSQAARRTESSVIEDDEDEEEDSTVLFQAYQLPPGWIDGDTSFEAGDSDAKKKAIEAYVKKTSAGLKNSKGLILFFFVEEEPPSIRMVSLKDESAKEWSFGRTETNNLVFGHQSVSEHHGSLVYEGGKWLLQDKDSKNGIWFNNTRCKSLELEDGKQFYVGSVEVLARLVNHQQKE